MLEELMAYLNYDPETGIFRWRKPSSRRVKVGEVAGSVRVDGYVSIVVQGKRFFAHTLALWFICGVRPKLVDHINGVNGDNRICNLRVATKVQNSQNTEKPHSNSSTGLLGAFKDSRSGKFRSKIRASGKQISLGSFDTAELAHEAYMKKKKELHEFAR